MNRSSGSEEVDLVVRLGKEQLDQLKAKRAHKQYWLDCDIEYLLAELNTRRLELKGALAIRADASLVWRKAADVANFAAMVADRYAQREQYFRKEQR